MGYLDFASSACVFFDFPFLAGILVMAFSDSRSTLLITDG